MVLDVTLFRDEGDPELIRESQRRRYQSPDVVDKVREADEKWKTGLQDDYHRSLRRSSLRIRSIKSKKKRSSRRNSKEKKGFIISYV